MHKKLLVAAFVTIFALAGCSDPHDALIPSDVENWEQDLAPELKKLSDEERQKAAAYLMRAKMGEAFGGTGIPPGTTVGQAIDAQRLWEEQQAAKRAEEEALKLKIERERASALEALNEAVTVSLIAKREIPRNFRARRYSDYQEFQIGVRNDTDKTIIGVAGQITFIDVFEKEVGAVGFRISEEIEAGNSVTWTGGRDYNEFIDEHRSVWNLEEGKYSTRFEPEMIVFKDGTKLTLPE